MSFQLSLTRRTLLPAVILFIALAVFTTLRVTRPVQAPVEAQERVWRVEVTEARPASLAPALTLYGRVETPSLLKAAAPAEAIVAEVLVREGDRVAQGDDLIVLDERDFLPRLDQAKAEVSLLEAEIASERERFESDQRALAHEKEILALGRTSVDRARSLKDQKLGSASNVDIARQDAARYALAVSEREYRIRNHEAMVRQLEARLLKAQAVLSDAELDYERSRIKAPFAGVVSSVGVAPGDRVQPAQVMLELYDPRSLEVRARVPTPYREELRRALYEGEPVTGTVERGGAAVRLRLDRISGKADPRGVDALFRIEAGADRLRLGEMAPFRLTRAPRKNAIALPWEALYGSNRIYRLDADDRMEAVEVEMLGSFFDEEGGEDMLVYGDALHKGDRIVVTHLPNAVTGLRTEVIE